MPFRSRRWSDFRCRTHLFRIDFPKKVIQGVLQNVSISVPPNIDSIDKVGFCYFLLSQNSSYIILFCVIIVFATVLGKNERLNMVLLGR